MHPLAVFAGSGFHFLRAAGMPADPTIAAEFWNAAVESEPRLVAFPRAFFGDRGVAVD
jgi:hypothetical protein